MVLGERFLGAEPEYLVKWVGYSEEESAWEPQSALGDCWKRVQEFKAFQVKMR